MFNQSKAFFRDHLYRQTVAMGLFVAMTFPVHGADSRAVYPDHPIKLVVPYTPGGKGSADFADLIKDFTDFKYD